MWGSDGLQTVTTARNPWDTADQGASASGPRADAVRWDERYARLLVATDALAVLGAAIGVHVADASAASAGRSWHLFKPIDLFVTVGVVVVWLAALAMASTRRPGLIGQGPTEYKRVMQATFSVFGGIAISSFLFGWVMPRAYVLVMMPAGLVAIILSRFLSRRWLHRRRAAGEMMTRVLAVGDAKTVNDLIRELQRVPLCGYVVIGACIPLSSGPVVLDVPVIGDLDNILDVVQRTDADAVAVTASGAFGADAVRALSWELEDSTAELMLAPALTNIAGPRIHTEPVAGLPLIHVGHPCYREANQLLKRAFDVVGATVLLMLFAPLLLAVAVAVKIGSAGPAFFRQQRVGLNGKTFNIIKFRSMVAGAESELAALRTVQSRDAGNVVMFKAKDDPRITSIGKFIRRFSIDEVPQLLNVIRGSMSLVGPRPPLLHEVELYGVDARRRLLVKPGMTGLWQVSGRSDLSWDDTVRLDIFYVENWSLTADLVILWKTMKAVLAPSGAY